MLAVIADDFTGAAEIAGTGLRYGLKVELTTSFVEDAKADLLVVSTDSRSLNKIEAERITTKAVKNILKLKPEFIYKKIDSVFRGHVLDEVKIQMKVTGLSKALVMGGNPSLGRTIKGGRYFINEKPISETGFANDPEFAVKDSSVLKMLRSEEVEVTILKSHDQLNGDGIIIGEAVSTEDMKQWAGKVTADYVVAGAADFFKALLERKYSAKPQEVVAIEQPFLYVSGTAFDKSQMYIKDINKQLSCVIYLPGSIINGDDKGMESWINKVNEVLKAQKRAIVAIDKGEKLPAGISAAVVRINMAKAVTAIIERSAIKELFIEGGSTAAAILENLKITTLQPVNELRQGVVRMQAKRMYITVKPGSYELPEEIRKIYL